MTIDHFFNIELLKTINEVTGPGEVADTDLLGTTIDYAKALSLLATMITFSIKAYGMMVGDKRLEIMPLFRPFALISCHHQFQYFFTGGGLPVLAVEQHHAGSFYLRGCGHGGKIYREDCGH